jgi:class 3 adenylate cyclase
MDASYGALAPDTRRREQRLVLVLADLAGFTRAMANLSALEIADVVDHFYRLCGDLVPAHRGRIVKFAGDNCLAVFEPAAAPDAVSCVLALRDAVTSMGLSAGLDLDLGVNVHLATVVAGSFGDPSAPTDDVMGVGVFHTYRMGSGPGIRISEPVYRKLPSGDRAGWRKHQPPATYSLEPGEPRDG